MHPFKSLLLFLFLIPLFSLAQNSRERDSLYARLQEQLHDTDRVNTLNALAKSIRYSESPRALELAREAGKLAVKTGYRKGEATAMDICGVIFLSMGDSKKALEHHLKALGLFDELGYEKGTAFSYNNLGAVYSYLKNYDRAEYYYLKSLELKKQIGLNRELSSSYVNLGNIKMHQHKPKECIAYYEQALANSLRHNDKQNITISYMNLGEAYYDIRSLDVALMYYNKARPYILESQNHSHEAHALFAKGKIFTDMSRFEEAESSFKAGLQIAVNKGLRSLELNIYKYFSQLYEKWNKPQVSISYYKKYILLNDSIFNNESVKSLNEMQARYDVEAKDRQIELLNKDKIIAEATISRDKLVKRTLIAGFALFMLIVVILTRNIYLKQKVNKLLTVKNQEIERQRMEIERQNEQLTNYNKELMKENVSARYEILKAKINPHFLFNSLTTLSNLIRNDQGSAMQFVTKFSKLYRKILELGDTRLISIEEEINLVSEFLYIQKIRFHENLLYTISIHKSHYENMVPPFSIQLIVENAIKHNSISRDHKLMISIFSENDCIIVSNNIQRKEIPEDSTRVGQKNILERYKLIGSKSPEFTEEKTRYVVSLPIIKSEEVI